MKPSPYNDPTGDEFTAKVMLWIVFTLLALVAGGFAIRIVEKFLI
jgi:hypothetical protein